MKDPLRGAAWDAKCTTNSHRPCLHGVYFLVLMKSLNNTVHAAAVLVAKLIFNDVLKYTLCRLLSKRSRLQNNYV